MAKTKETSGEIWKPVVGYEGFYDVSNLGRVRSVSRRYCISRVLKHTYHKNGYPLVFLSRKVVAEDGGVSYKKTVKVHRLVAEAFLGLSELTVNHKNGIKDDNRVENLEWISHEDNIRHAWKTGINKKRVGRQLVWTRLTEEKAREIKHSKLPRKDLARQFNMSYDTIRDIQVGRSWSYIQ